MEKMFCFQCQETSKNQGCTVRGVCGKSSDVSNAQDLLIWITKGMSEITTRLRKEGKSIGIDVNRMVIKNLFTTITNANFDLNAIDAQIEKTIETKDCLLKSLSDRNGLLEAATWSEKCEKGWRNKSRQIGVFSVENEDIRSLRELATYGLKGLSAYYEHANVLGKSNEDIDAFIQRALAYTLKTDVEVDKLISLVLEVGKYGFDTMSLLDDANTSTYGNPEITEVNIGVGKNPAILISGHDLKDLEMLLEQTENSGVDVYTHSEMLPGHYYPELKKYKHFVGNYGNAWWKQQEEFEKFNGPILMTTNCIVPPKDSYKDRVYTTGVAGFEGLTHIESDENGHKDFSIIIKHAKKCSVPMEIEKGSIIGGFAHKQVESLASKVVDAIKNGDIEKFVVMAGCDGRMKDRNYYTEFAKKVPKKAVILTAGCAKYRYNKLNLGDINGIPRVLDAGQCNDSYSLVKIALTLKDAFNLEDVNDLPIVYNIAWYEQKAVIVLLSLLYLGVKNIHLGPTLPAFLSKNVVDVLVDKFGISGISSVDDDIEKFFN